MCECPLVTIIVPSYNYSQFISLALESVLAQTYTNWECIVVDDGSTDDTRAVVAEFLSRDSRFRYIHQSNQGLSAARNTGIRRGRGEYFQFLDSDDRIEAEKIERQVAYLEAHPDADVVYGGVRYFHTGDVEERRLSLEHLGQFSGVSGRGAELQRQLAHVNLTVVNAPLVRRTYIATVGGFDTCINPVSDWDFWLRGALHDKCFQFHDSPGTLALVRYHATSMSAVTWRMAEVTFLMHRKHSTGPVAAVREISAMAVDYAIAQMLRLARGEIEDGQRPAGVRHLRRLSTLTGRPKYRLYAAAALLPPRLFAPALHYSENVILPAVARRRGRI